MATIDRAATLRAATLVRAALATQDYIPALQHIRFDGETALAYNDIAAIEVRCDLDSKVCIPGDQLIRVLNSFGADSLNMRTDSTGSSVVISSGKSKIKVPILELKAHPYDRPSFREDEAIDASLDILKGMELCLLAVGSDPTHPAQMGVTLDVDENGKAVLWSTDNFTISRYQTDSEITLPDAEPVLLPIFFCQQVLVLSKAFPKEAVTICHSASGGAVYAKIGSAASIMSRTLLDLEPLDFHRLFSTHCGSRASLKRAMQDIPDLWDAALQRALLVCSDLDKATEFRIEGTELHLLTTGSSGVSEECLPWEGNSRGAPAGAFHIDPTLLRRVSAKTEKLVFSEQAVALSTADGSYIHLIAYSTK